MADPMEPHGITHTFLENSQKNPTDDAAPISMPAPIAVPRFIGKQGAKRKSKDAQIDMIPCKVCGDKSTGLHYGVTTCEGCKGFFRRSQTIMKPYKCSSNGRCNIDCSNRSKCQYCRWTRCLEVGMSREGVKFGRMTKMEREKLQGEATMHMQMNDQKRRKTMDKGNAASEMNGNYASAVGDSSNGSYSSHNSPEDLTPIGNYGMQYSGAMATNSYTVYTQLSPMSSSGCSSSHAPTPPMATGTANVTSGLTMYNTDTLPSHNGFAQDYSKPEGFDNVIKEISVAFERTCIYTKDQIQYLRQHPMDNTAWWAFSNMAYADRWLHEINQLNSLIHKIVEFAKSVHGFTNLPQEDKIMLIKSAAIEMVIIHMVPLYDLNSHTIVYSGVCMPTSAFYSHDLVEQQFIQDLFTIVHQLSGFNMTESEIGLYSALVLTSPGRANIQNQQNLIQAHRLITECLQVELGANHGDIGAQLFQHLSTIRPVLQNLSNQHIFILNLFLQMNPIAHAFPPLYKELFVRM